ncbi:MAG: dihydrodipicolinate synthase family protein, partial [Eubacterium sp.]|nr:dihydrodipicolinate synthase family protein [Eubacterium sp.]
MTDLNKFRGIFCALNAIYDENDNIDEGKIKEVVKVYKSLGVKGVYACGSTGEGFLLSTDERKQVAKAVKEAAGDDFTVIVHV